MADGHGYHLDSDTEGRIEFAARMSNVTPAQLIARLVAQASLPAVEASGSAPDRTDERVPIYADYEGYRTKARFDPRTSRIDITSGPLDGKSFRSPSSAARAIVGHYKPDVSPHRNGWSFWLLDDGTGRLLQSIRHGDAR